jgi:hypothetical protein
MRWVIFVRYVTAVSSYNIVTCIPIARQRLGKHVLAVNASTIEKLFSMWSEPRPLLCNGALNTPKTIRDNRRQCFPWGPCRVVIKKNSIEQHRVESRVSERQIAGIWAWEQRNWIESSLRNCQLQNNGKKGIRRCKENFMCDLKWRWDCQWKPLLGYD